MSKRSVIILVSALTVFLLVAYFVIPELLKSSPSSGGITMSYSYCIDTAPGLSVLEQDTAYRNFYYQFCLIDSFAHYYVKTVILQADTFAISTLNHPARRVGFPMAIAASGTVLEKETTKEKGLALFSTINGKFLSRIMLPDNDFKTVALLDHLGSDSLEVRRVFEERRLLNLVRKCH